MRKIAAILASVAVAAGIALASLPAHAAAPVNWRQRTCQAAASYQRHPSRAGLEALVVDSFRVAPKYLGADVGQLYADVEGSGGKYAAKDLRWIADDCKVW